MKRTTTLAVLTLSTVLLAHDEATGSYKKMAARIKVREYKKLLNFLRNHDLGVRR